jgi:hypothetical protein
MFVSHLYLEIRYYTCQKKILQIIDKRHYWWLKWNVGIQYNSVHKKHNEITEE